jgi:hypothetical protein
MNREDLKNFCIAIGLHIFITSLLVVYSFARKNIPGILLYDFIFNSLSYSGIVLSGIFLMNETTQSSVTHKTISIFGDIGIASAITFGLIEVPSYFTNQINFYLTSSIWIFAAYIILVYAGVIFGLAYFRNTLEHLKRLIIRGLFLLYLLDFFLTNSSGWVSYFTFSGTLLPPVSLLLTLFILVSVGLFLFKIALGYSDSRENTPLPPAPPGL